MKKATVTFYGGVNEIGGNKILLEDSDTKVLLDFGMSFALRSQYYSVPFLSPRSEKELLDFGILPDLEGVYKFDNMGPKIDAVFLSHSHMDHAAYVSFLEGDTSLLRRNNSDYLGRIQRSKALKTRIRLQGLEIQNLPHRRKD